jgi:Domain of unknown function (DUF5069)
MKTPRSPFDQVGGMVYFARMLDKIRLSARGQLRQDFQRNLGSGFDGRCTRYLHIRYTELVDRALRVDQTKRSWRGASRRAER